MKKILFVSLFLILLSGCGISKQSPAQTEDKEEKNVEVSAPVDLSDNFKPSEDESIQVKDGVIYSYGEKRGTTQGDKIVLDFEGQSYSFAGDIKKLNFIAYRLDDRKSPNTIYNGLTIHIPKKTDELVVNYDNCSNNIPPRIKESLYCNTNRKNLIDYYLFTPGYHFFTTGADLFLTWNKEYIKKLGNTNILFGGNLNDIGISSFPDFYPSESLEIYTSLLKYGLIENLDLNTSLTYNYIDNDDEKEDFKKISEKLEPIDLKMRELFESKKYLDFIKNEPEYIAKEKEWNDLVNSFEEVK